MSATRQETEHDPARQLRESPRPRTLERSFGLIAGILFIGGAFAGIPSSMLIHPAPPASLYLITVAGIAVGLAAMVIPWERISRAWAHVAMVVAIIQVALTVALAGDPFVFYFVFIAIFAAYAFSDRNQVAIYIGLIAIALLVPIIVIPGSTRATAAQALAAIPAIALVAVMVAFLRERLEDNRRTTRRFAREALALSVRIGRLPVESPPSSSGSLGGRVEPRHPRWRRAAIGVSTGLIAIAGLGTLAAAGVALPGPIEKPFASVGIEPSGGGSSNAQPPGDQPRATAVDGAQTPSQTGTAQVQAAGSVDGDGDGDGDGGGQVGTDSAGEGTTSTTAEPFSDASPPVNSSDGPATTGSPAASPADPAPSTPDTSTPQPPAPAPNPTPPSSPDSTPKLGDTIRSAIDNLFGPKTN